MLFEGVKLLFVGMTAVLLFLSFTILLIQLVSHLARGAAQKEIAAINSERARRGIAQKKAVTAVSLPGKKEEYEDDIAVIAAAVAAYEAEIFARS